MIWEWSATLSSPNSHLHIWQCVACSCLLLSSSVITIGSRQKEVLAYKKCSTTIITQQHVVRTNQQVLYSALCAYVVYTSVYVKDIISTLYIKHMEWQVLQQVLHTIQLHWTTPRCVKKIPLFGLPLIIWEWSATLSSPNSPPHMWQWVDCSCFFLSSGVITIGSR